MKNSIVVFGSSSSLQTRILIYWLNSFKLKFDFISIENVSKKNLNNLKIINFFLKFKSMMNSGAFKSLSIFHWFTWYLILERYLNKNHQKIINLKKRYSKTSFKPVLSVENINSKEVATFLEKKNYDYALFASVPIVNKNNIDKISKFCLNAHPAPLPECPGGGALEHTLNLGLKPSVSVHIANETIDSGDILHIRQIELDHDDNFVTITYKLEEMCSKILADVISRINEGEVFKRVKNNGKLNFWKDCTPELQIRVRKILKKILLNLEAK